jgi:CBS domain-containing protein
MVRDVMRRRWISLSPSAGLLEARQLMRLARVRQLPVVADGGLLIGVVSYADLLIAALEGVPDKTVVGDVMGEAIETATVEMPLAEAALLMVRGAAGYLPVVGRTREGLRLLGLVTESDLLRLAYDARAGTSPS